MDTTTATMPKSSILALDPHCIEGFVEGCLERKGEDYPGDEAMLRDLWEDEKNTVLDILKAECEMRIGRPEDHH